MSAKFKAAYMFFFSFLFVVFVVIVLYPVVQRGTAKMHVSIPV